MSEMEWLNIFSGNLVSMLDDVIMTPSELADETGLSRATISRYINKQQMPKITAIINIAEALNCSIDELVDVGERIEL